MSRSLPHLTLTTSTSSLSPTSPIFPTMFPSHPSLLAHDPYSPCEDSLLSCGSTQIPSLTIMACPSSVCASLWFNRIHVGTDRSSVWHPQQRLQFWKIRQLSGNMKGTLQRFEEETVSSQILAIDIENIFRTRTNATGNRRRLQD